MLTLELAGQQYNKSALRRELKSRLDGRSDASIEFKRGNISAVLIRLGYPYVRGYQPRANYQQLLLDVVLQRVAGFPLLEEAALTAVQQPASTPILAGFDSVIQAPPERLERAAEPTPTFLP